MIPLFPFLLDDIDGVQAEILEILTCYYLLITVNKWEAI